ncbi:mannose/fructose/N-acetylgalactosamine-specific phosphotransferase system component IID [Enterococcus sp. PF1-24]|uniref:PTS system mannose/fructose/sorbose family transporter subunit IID n=1 Tax=unclassified Enterococcus TaxID=2608891 RepID=UPI002476CBAB|nr:MULTISPECIES: PTS system mannose/fructose/sorbose family transporter subunit IID [unclassified Enterococcus]MDH6365413.1 mannose/fructose/N-acetylgalactosamine-specific phosphotransferase system component IID [Enterococcus sp. PFB1-1]MDH6402515.1 mannose/fructose/N-acetylgalactosamine-specific phosphotransferase system component IID [Enterococcus sp. PF1-24]
MTNNKISIEKADKKILNKVFWRTLTLSVNYNYERMQAFGFVFTMIPAINKYYSKKEDRIEAYQRHFELFNTTPSTGGFITGLTTSMEKEASKDQDFDKNSINAIKVSLMGPLAGIGDSIFWGSLRVISLGVGISLAAKGSLLGLFVHLLLFNVPAHLVRYYGTMFGFGLGSSFIKKATENGLIDSITKGATTVGLMTVGAMTCTLVNFNIEKSFMISGQELNIQEILDGIFPNVLPILLTFICYKAVTKNVKPITIMLAMMVISIIAKMVGII